MKKLIFVTGFLILTLSGIISAQGRMDLWVGQYNDYYDCEVKPVSEVNVLNFAGIYEMSDANGRFFSYNISFNKNGLMNASYTSKGIIGLITEKPDIIDKPCASQGVATSTFECDSTKFTFIDIKFINKKSKTVTARGMVEGNVHFFMKAGSEKVE